MVIYWSDCENTDITGAYHFCADPLLLSDLILALRYNWDSTPDTPLTHLYVRPRRVWAVTG